MCGILSVTGKEQDTTSTELLQRLQRLEYRGYDSFGLGSFNSTADQAHVEKHVGKVSDHLKTTPEETTLRSAVAHTRWATHGAVTVENTHPHVSYDGNVILVHNGVIENYQKIKQFLICKNVPFVSDTDTEVISNLLAYTFNQVTNLKQMDRIEGLQTCIRQLQGSYAISFIHKDDPSTICYAKKGSPLVLGREEDNSKFYVSSDIYTFIDKTNQVQYLSDGDYGYLSPGICVKYNLKDQVKTNCSWTTVTASYDQVELGDHQHYMIKEICEQRNVIQNTVRNQPQGSVNELTNKIKTARRVIFSACGSSYYSSMVGANLLRSQGLLCECVLSSEFDSHSSTLEEKDVIVCVSQSGETADIIESINVARDKKCTVVGVVNVPNSSIDRLADYTVYVNAGPELCVLSTKSFTSQIALFMLVYQQISGHEICFDALESNIYELVAKSTRDSIRRVAEQLYSKEHIYVLGRGEQYSVALEAALKIKEVSYIHAEGFAGGELKHGSIALIEQDTPCILLVTKQHELELLANGAELKSRGARIIGVSHEPNELFDHYIRVNECDMSGPLLQIIPIQLLSYNLALLKNLDPDKPRNLAKSVTVK